MMLKKYIKNLLIFLPFSLLLSCSGNEDKNEKEALAYTYVTVEHSHPTCEDQDQDKRCMEISYTFPRFTSESSIPVKDSLQHAFASFLFDNKRKPLKMESFKELTRDMFALYDSTLTTLPDYNLPWELRLGIRFIYQTPEYLSLKFGEYEFSGGAHSNELHLYRTYSIPDGKRLTLSDLIKNNSMNRLTALADSLFRSEKELPEEATYEDHSYFFKGGEFSLNNNYALTKEGVLFYYNPYEIAPFSEGPTRLLLSYDHVNPLLADPYKSSSVVNNEEVN